MALPRDEIATKRLDSWKEIAAFLGRAERTARRWESERGLPVHRVPGSSRSAVFAYSGELSDWLKGQSLEPETDTEPGSEEVFFEETSQSPRSTPIVALEQPQATGQVQAEIRNRSRSLLWLGVFFVGTLALALFAVAFYRGQLPKTLGNRRAPDREAVDLYLKGRYFWDRRTPQDLNTAIDYFTQAIVKDPSDAQAYGGLADCYNLLREFGAMPAAEAYPRALAAAQRAVELDDSSAEAHSSLAFATFWWSWKGVTAEREFKRALQLNPNLVRAHHWYATFLMALHRYPEALDQIEQAQKLEPSSSAILADKGFLLWSAGRQEEGMTLLRQLDSTDTGLSSTHYYLARIDWEEQKYTDAIEEWRLLADQRHDTAGIALADACAKAYRSGGAHGLLETQMFLQKKAVDTGSGSAYDLAATYAALGDKQNAIAYLRIAYDRRDANLLTGDPPIRSLQNDPAYQKLKSDVERELAQ